MNLEKLYKMQEELDNHILENYFKRTGKRREKGELLEDTKLALIVEVSELANTTRCFKKWSTKGMMEKEIILEELADAWHFYLSIGNQTMTRFNYKLSRYMTSNFQRKLDEKDLTKQFNEFCKGVANEQQWAGIGVYLINIADILNFTDEEVEQAYLKKHEENYRRQEEGY